MKRLHCDQHQAEALRLSMECFVASRKGVWKHAVTYQKECRSVTLLYSAVTYLVLISVGSLLKNVYSESDERGIR